MYVLLHYSLSSLVSALQFCGLQTDIAAGCVQFVTWRKSNNSSCATMTKTALNSVNKANMSSWYLKLLQILFVPYCHRHHFMQPSTQFIQATKIKLLNHIKFIELFEAKVLNYCEGLKPVEVKLSDCWFHRCENTKTCKLASQPTNTKKSL